MTNLLTETTSAIARSGHDTSDIIFIGSRQSGHSCTWDEFVNLADMEYDSGYGGQEIAQDLEVVFGDGATMWRDEYDGSESWSFSRPFVMPDTLLSITTLRNGDPWATLEEMHRPGGKYADE